MAASLWWDEPNSSPSSVTNHNTRKQQEDLSVFGYACKLFRDDERAREIDQGKLLIPWMGDESLMIDRYDGRGHLYDLVAHDAAKVANKNAELSEEEQAIEKACDEERYLELYKDVQEEAMYEEEEWKRYYLALQEGYQAVGFSYDQQQREENKSLIEDKGQLEEEENTPFVAPEELNVPASMVQPTCSKQNARIEKTASFIAQHGIQMEIMLKTRQAGNAQFNFLYFEDALNPYYKHVVSMIKSGRYKPQATEEKEENYLHPSLSSTTQVPLPPPPPPQKPIELPKVAIHDTPYGALINSFKKYSAATSASPTNGSPMPEDEQENEPYSNHHDEAPYQEQKPSEIYAPAASTLYGPALEDQLCGHSPSPSRDQKNRKKKRRRRARSSSSDSSSSSSSSSSRSSHKRRRSKSPLPKSKPRPEGPSAIIQPPDDIKPIIDRMALYVAKNGIEFEMVVMSRNDPRFQFLNEYHAYFPYYRSQREIFLKELGRDLETDGKKEEAKEAGLVSVSFSIKAKSKESEPVPASKSKLFDYDSSEGEEGPGQQPEPVSESPSRTATPPARAQGEEDSLNAEEKVRDKLASALKERISQSSKEKNLQAERKRKAAMFLTMLKANQSQPSSPPATTTEDSSSLYVGEGASSSAVVFEYDNQPTPHRVDKARSPREKRRHRKSPTPPSAYNLDRRSPARSSPPRRQGRGSQWSSSWDRDRDRDRDYSWQRHYSDYGKSPPRKDEKKKKHKRSRSRSPSKREKSSDRTRHSKEKSKHKSKDRDRSREKKKKSRYSRSKDKEISKLSSVRTGRDSSSSDVEVIEAASESSSTKHLSHDKVTNGNAEKRSRAGDGQIQNDILDMNIPLPDSTLSSSLSSGGISALQSRLPNNPPDTTTSKSLVGSSRLSSHLTDNSDTQDSLTNTKTDVSPTLTPSSSSSDLRNKVRAMLKRSREMILKEEGFTFDDT